MNAIATVTSNIVVETVVAAVFLRPKSSDKPRAARRNSAYLSRTKQYAWCCPCHRCLSTDAGGIDKKEVALSPSIEETLFAAEPNDVLELDEV
jgi:hypothetical protein